METIETFTAEQLGLAACVAESNWAWRHALR